uniref:Uncharacterized protein n=1 Tax=Podoviridae sp. ctqve24 TaxID=2826580 RepID=A0A8S5MHM0_9CAUD|nr:MAG TPA: hypothetical protein [Podoviridae sp. ctqve24]
MYTYILRDISKRVITETSKNKYRSYIVIIESVVK